MVSITAAVLSSCSSGGEVKAPPGLALVGDGGGVPFAKGQSVLSIAGRALRLPDGSTCLPDASSCPSLEAIPEFTRSADSVHRDARIVAVDIPPEEPIAALGAPLNFLRNALPGPLTEVCLRAAGTPSGKARCLNVKIRPASALGDWMDAPWPVEKLRLMIRNDGMEVITIHGKVLGGDRYGPSIPARKGVHDFPALARNVSRLAMKFSDEHEVALLLSPQTTFQTAAIAVDTLQRASGGQFTSIIFVY